MIIGFFKNVEMFFKKNVKYLENIKYCHVNLVNVREEETHRNRICQNPLLKLKPATFDWE